ncbi:MAG: cytochrome c [Bdellovibrionales bacterium]|nr:cytochrome c [Bdellovibrionales bacterium]
MIQKFFVVSLLIIGSSLALAKDPPKLAVCAACHGKDGVGTQPKYPNLAGQHEVYLIAQLKAFKSGERKNPEMQPMAAMLSDADMKELAAYYAGLKKK